MYTLESANHEKTVNKAIALLDKYFAKSEGDNVARSFQGTIPWYELESLDYLFAHCQENASGIKTHQTPDWAISFITGSLKSNQNKVVITYFISVARSVFELLIDAGFTNQEADFLIEQYDGNLNALGILVESKLVTTDSIKF